MNCSKKAEQYKKYTQLRGNKSIILFYYDLLKSGIIKIGGSAHNRMKYLQDKQRNPIKYLEKSSKKNIT